ncbi:MAG: hypothetical protein AAGC80_32320, partial [Rhodococcus sp. (in: high G+C Gram-positive bacteria)]
MSGPPEQFALFEVSSQAPSPESVDDGVADTADDVVVAEQVDPGPTVPAEPESHHQSDVTDDAPIPQSLDVAADGAAPSPAPPPVWE